LTIITKAKLAIVPYLVDSFEIVEFVEKPFKKDALLILDLNLPENAGSWIGILKDDHEFIQESFWMMCPGVPRRHLLPDYGGLESRPSPKKPLASEILEKEIQDAS